MRRQAHPANQTGTHSRPTSSIPAALELEEELSLPQVFLMEIVIFFALALGLLVIFGAGAMVWGERRVARSNSLHRSS